jgi:hypothetical protein
MGRLAECLYPFQGCSETETGRRHKESKTAGTYATARLYDRDDISKEGHTVSIG